MEWSSAFRKLVSHNKDIQRLLDEGYAIAFDNNHLIVRDIPYLDGNEGLQQGAFVFILKDIDGKRVQANNHVAFFAGGIPHGLDGKPIPNLNGSTAKLILKYSDDVVVERLFSTKPKPSGRYDDLHHQISHYTAVIAAPAIEKFGADPLTYRIDPSYVDDSVFKFNDTLTTRAMISDLSAKLEDDVIAIIGLGGTGSYLLDFMVKCPVKEIRAFDSKRYYVHSAYRSPGRLAKEELDQSKAQVHLGRYGNFRHNLRIQDKYISEDSDEEIEGVTFAFVCVDKGPSRSRIFDLLIRRRIPFIDVGMGLNRKRDSLNGMLRATYYSKDQADARRDMNLAEMNDNPNEEYRANVQIAELNALNASLAVVMYKQLRGFYFLEDENFNYAFEIGDLKIVSQDQEADTSKG